MRSSTNSGPFIVVSDNGCMNVLVRFINTGYETITRREHVKTGRIKDPYSPNVFGVGYVGVGKHKTGSHGVHTKKHNTWKGMMERCYSPKLHAKFPTYIDCEVCPQWHNFQTFGDWFDDNYIEDFQLDKDILVKGNKLYSPITCIFVSKHDNIRESSINKKMKLLMSPMGVQHDVMCIRDFANEHQLSESHLSDVIRGVRKTHKGWTKA